VAIAVKFAEIYTFESEGFFAGLNVHSDGFLPV